jgi:hypothetical protein
MTFAPYYYGESEPSDDKDEQHIDKIAINGENKDDRDAELVELVNQYMTPLTSEFKASMND